MSHFARSLHLATSRHHSDMVCCMTVNTAVHDCASAQMFPGHLDLSGNAAAAAAAPPMPPGVPSPAAAAAAAAAARSAAPPLPQPPPATHAKHFSIKTHTQRVSASLFHGSALQR